MKSLKMLYKAPSTATFFDTKDLSSGSYKNKSLQTLPGDDTLAWKQAAPLRLV
jgi:hypothetical protein